MTDISDENTIRILVSTDNHVGYEERDPIRKDDSWKTFDEIMTLARTQDVDMVLLGGDLFHDNKPSRKSMFQVMRSLRKNCLGMKPCELEFLSDAQEVFEGAFSKVNYEDEDINIAIPVFSIHGNHDDPSGDGHLCSLDLLQVAGLVNYFGRVAEADNIEAKPILLQKGSTRLALYGLSNVRDERMFRTFRDHKVKWFRPGEAQADWFNLLTVHQNHHAHTATSYLPENVLPDWMNLVVWGHEHECLIEPRKNAETGFHVMQPGSSVATSLCPGEAVAKHVAIVNVRGREFTVDKLPLRSVRPFVMREIVLSQERRFKGLDRVDARKDMRLEITKRLMEVVDDMIRQAADEWLEMHPDETAESMPLPLIRLKVEYSPSEEGGNYDVENPQRFSNRFVGRVANTNDVVLFHRRKTAAKKSSKNSKADLPDETELSVESGVKVDVLVQEFLQAQSLKILPQAPFGDAVNQFVSKDDKHAMEHFVSESLSGQVQQMLALDSDDDDLDAAMQSYRAQLDEKFAAGAWSISGTRRRIREKPRGWDSDLEGHWEDQPEAQMAPDEAMESENEQPAPATLRGKRRTAAPARTAAAKTSARKTAAPRGRATKQVVIPEDDEVMDDLDDEPAPEPAPTRTGRGRRAAATVVPTARPRGAGSRAAAASSSSTSTTTRRTATTRQSTLSFSQGQTTSSRAATKKSREVMEISDDDVEDDDDEDEDDEDGFEPPPTATRSRRR
ncbi:Double-strand break repair protein mus-23 [Ceratocystis platani]|uniref:Double-strand break repair protein n=1 Tax=Ceratocystis fimbriata f. sp. platani TaxID=88771 RepID=A0A0F8BJP5_CERFI|nr:Double-strand break repair protein mus-23 [Ceratocystis platani]